MKLPLVSGRQAVKALTRLGFVDVSRKGSHVKMKHSDGRMIVFPFHDEIDRFTPKGALKDADIEIEDFVGSLK